MRIALLAALAAVLGCQVSAQPGQPPASTPATNATPPAKKAEEPPLLGRWTGTRFEAGGQVDTKDRGEWGLHVTEDIVAIRTPGAESKRLQYRFDDDAKPRKITLGERLDGQFFPASEGIYKIEGGALTVCFSVKAPRPQEFAAKAGSSTVMMTLKPEPPLKNGRAYALEAQCKLSWLTAAVESVAFDKVLFVDRMGRLARIDTKELLIVRIKMNTADKTRRYVHRTWGAKANGEPNYRAMDNFGNEYVLHYQNELVQHRSENLVVDASAAVTDVIVIDKPVPAAEYLDIDLDMDRVEKDAKLRFRIPRAAWAK